MLCMSQLFAPKNITRFAIHAACLILVFFTIHSSAYSQSNPVPPNTPLNNQPPVTVGSSGQVTVNNNSFVPPSACAGGNSQLPECQSAMQNVNPAMRGVDASAATTIDMNYTTKEFKCLPDREVWGSCPKEAMPHKRTRLKSFSDLSPYLWASLHDPNEPGRKYEGPYYRNPPGSRRDVHAIISPLNNVADRFAGCVHQIEVPNSTTLTALNLSKSPSTTIWIGTSTF